MLGKQVKMSDPQGLAFFLPLIRQNITTKKLNHAKRIYWGNYR